MKLKRLTIANFGPFQGEHCFELEPCVRNSSRPTIVLFGGKNGTGKTTILDSIRLCLYGRRALGDRIRAVDYEAHLHSRFHQANGGDHAEYASVTLEFEYVHWGQIDIYEVSRVWTSTGSRLSESLTLRRNGELITEVFPEQWQSFINELIPIGLAELCFFDGERIQRLADDDAQNPYINDLVRRLLGLDTVERLHADLNIYMRKHSQLLRNIQLEMEIERLQAERDSIEEATEEWRSRYQNSQTELSRLNSQIVGLEQKFAAEGGDYARYRESLISERARCQTLLAESESEITDLASGLLPFCLVPELCRDLEQRLLAEANSRRWQNAKEIFEQRKDAALGGLRSGALWQHIDGPTLSPEAKLVLSEALPNLLSEILSIPEPFSRTESIHGLSDKDTQILLSWIRDALDKCPSRLQVASCRLMQSKEDLHEIEEKLERIPSDEVIAPLLEELKQIQVEFGRVQKRAEDEEEAIKAYERRKEEIDRKLEVLRDELMAQIRDERATILGGKVQSVLGEYGRQLKTTKVKHLESLISESLQILARKEGTFQQVTLDPENFAATIRNSEGRVVPKEILSAGEKQIYAIAILWGLVRSSGRALPIVVDTPLARMDATHRLNLLTRFFPYASHQLILLSTDTEINKQSLALLKSAISHCYHLVYDPNTHATHTEEGYFKFQ